MAFLDTTETVERLYSLLPDSWFPDLDDAPDLKAVLSMLGSTYSNDDEDGLYQFLQYVQAQTRVSTATGYWLDIIANDYFGRLIQRNNHETDDSFRRRIMLNLLAPRGTRCALFCNVENLTGYAPKIIELRNTGDCGAYSSIAEPVWGGAAYNEVGAYGTMLMPYQLLISVTRPFGSGIPNVSGYGMSGSGYATLPKPFGYVGSLRPMNFGMGEYVQLSDIVGPVTDSNIYQTIAMTMPAGTTAWTAISDPPGQVPPSGVGVLDTAFYIDFSLLAPEDAATPGGMYGSSFLQIIAHGKMEIGDWIGVGQIQIQAKGTMFLGDANTVRGTWTLPIQAVGHLATLPSLLTINIIASGVMASEVDEQPLLGIDLTLDESPIDYVGIDGSQPATGHTFVLGYSLLGDISLNAANAFGAQITSAIGRLLTTPKYSLTGNSLTSHIGSLLTNSSTGNKNTSITGSAISSRIGTFKDTLKATVNGNSLTTGIGVFAKTAKHGLTGASMTSAIGAVSVTTGVPQAWSSTHKNSNISVSGTTATMDSAAINAAVFAAKTASSGKYYWEITVTTTDITNVAVGFGCSVCDTSDGTWCGSTTEGLAWFGPNGAILNNNSSPLATWATYTSGQRLCIALDITNKLIWGRVGSGNWNNSSTANPATGVGGYNWGALTDLGTESPWSPGASLNSNGDTAVGYFDSGSWNFTAPAGFVQW